MSNVNTTNPELEELKKNINTLKGKLTTLEASKKDLENETNDLIAKAIYQKKLEIERSFDEIIREAEQRLKASEKEKEEEKKKNLAKLISLNTRSLKENNIYLKNEIKRILKDNSLPSFVNSKLYMSIWNPTNMAESFLGVISTIIILAIPTYLSFFMLKDKLISTFPNKILRYLVVAFIYMAVIFIAGLIWLFIEKITKKNPETLKEVVELRKNINDNKKEIKTISDNTKNEAGNDTFDYTKLDREIEAGKIELENYRNKKKAAIENFVNVTQDEIAKAFENEASKKKTAFENEIEIVKNKLSELQKEFDELRIREATS